MRNFGTRKYKKRDEGKNYSRKEFIFEIIKLILIPIIIAALSIYYTYSQKENEIRVKYVELAIDILKSQKTKENKHLRIYARDIIKEYSIVKLNKNVEKEFLNFKFDPFSAYDIEFQKKVGEDWIEDGGISTLNISMVSKIPNKNMRWHITYPMNFIVDEKYYEEYILPYIYGSGNDLEFVPDTN